MVCQNFVCGGPVLANVLGNHFTDFGHFVHYFIRRAPEAWYILVNSDWRYLAAGACCIFLTGCSDPGVQPRYVDDAERSREEEELAGMEEQQEAEDAAEQGAQRRCTARTVAKRMSVTKRPYR